MDTVMATIQSILHDKLGVDEARITPTSTLDSLGADDLDIVEVFLEIEKEFNITIPDEEATFLVTKPLQSLVKYVASRTAR